MVSRYLFGASVLAVAFVFAGAQPALAQPTVPNSAQSAATLLGAAFSETPASAALDLQAYRFAGTAWGASSDATLAQLKTHGFAFEQAEDDGSMIFTGTLNDRPALVVALFIDSGLSKILISVPTDEQTVLPVYREMRQILDGQYGTPEVEVETYAYPFAEGKHVGYETTALRVGKATIGALWQAKGEALGIRISERLIVSAHYESQAWKQEVDRRAQRSKSGL
jgi:hypothetical protein